MTIHVHVIFAHTEKKKGEILSVSSHGGEMSTTSTSTLTPEDVPPSDLQIRVAVLEGEVASLVEEISDLKGTVKDLMHRLDSTVAVEKTMSETQWLRDMSLTPLPLPPPFRPLQPTSSTPSSSQMVHVHVHPFILTCDTTTADLVLYPLQQGS